MSFYTDLEYMVHIGADKRSLVVAPNNDKAKELLNECKKRDAGKVRVKHPKLPNTWVFMQLEKAQEMGLI